MCDCSKIYHITLIVCAPNFVNLNNTTFQLNAIILCSFTFTAKLENLVSCSQIE